MITLTIDHGRFDELGCCGESEKMSRFKTLNFSSDFLKTAKLFWGCLENQIYASSYALTIIEKKI
jgi:hypothetical protein